MLAKEGKKGNQTWGSRVRRIWALENFLVRRIMKQPRASSQWKLPLWVPTFLTDRLGAGESDGEEAVVKVAMRGGGKLRFLK